MPKCPGQDTRYWKPEDVFDVICPACKHPVEFFKNDPVRKCDKCGHLFPNPNVDLGCAAWCPHASECLAVQMGLVKSGPAQR
jgi:formylmethanofuran dehydrogenase subunit E